MFIKDFIIEAVIDLSAYKYGYGKTYTTSVVDCINNFRNEICKKKSEATGNDEILLDKLLFILDNDTDIRKKKGLPPSHLP